MKQSRKISGAIQGSIVIIFIYSINNNNNNYIYIYIVIILPIPSGKRIRENLLEVS